MRSYKTSYVIMFCHCSLKAGRGVFSGQPPPPKAKVSLATESRFGIGAELLSDRHWLVWVPCNVAMQTSLPASTLQFVVLNYLVFITFLSKKNGTYQRNPFLISEVPLKRKPRECIRLVHELGSQLVGISWIFIFPMSAGGYGVGLNAGTWKPVGTPESLPLNESRFLMVPSQVDMIILLIVIWLLLNFVVNYI